MGQIVPDAVEQYLAGLNRLRGDPCSTRSRAATSSSDLPLVDAEVGALLRVLATSIGATRILEIGTAIGYSGIWLARRAAGRRHAGDDGDRPGAGAGGARGNFARAGLADRVNVMVGDAQLMIAKVAGPFDLIFQDGDKKLYTPLLDRLVALLRPGGLLVTDNVLWDGEVVPGFVDRAAARTDRHARHRRLQRARRRAPAAADQHRPAARRRRRSR